jgi:DNA-binding GntR family transcriptional regulator
LRALLEVKAALEASRRMSDAEFVELDRRLEALDGAVAKDRYYESAQADLEFHRYIWQCSGNDVLCRHLELLTVPLFAFISILRSQGLQRLTSVVEAHQPLITALRSQDEVLIKETFRRAATSAYGSFVGNGSGRAVVQAFGLLDASE